MVYKKYIKRNGKTYGPYYYESYREDGRVKTRFVKGPSKRDRIGEKIGRVNSKKIYQAVFFSVLIIVVTVLFFFGSVRIGSLVISEESLEEDRIEIVEAYRLNEDREIVEDVYDVIGKKDGDWLNVMDGEYVRVKFEEPLTSENDITLFARSVDGSGRIEVYPENSEGLITVFESIIEEKWYQRLLTNLLRPTQIFDLKIFGNLEIDYVTDPAPSTNWTEFYSENNGTRLRGLSIAADNFGNSFVGGYTNESVLGAFTTFLVIKYNSTGQHQWNLSVVGGGNSSANSVAVDNKDVVYVAGFVNKSNNISDFYTIALNSTDGTNIWNMTYNDSTSTTKIANGIAVDTDDGVYVTGTHLTEGSGGEDVVVVKYNSTNGDSLWNVTYGAEYNQIGSGVVTGNDDRIYVSASEAPVGDFDMLLIAYNATDGTEIWSKQITEANNELSYGVTADARNNSYIVGSNDDVFGFRIYAVNYSGDVTWNRTHLIGGESATPYAIAFDEYDQTITIVGEVNVGNSLYYLTKYNATDGVNIWNKSIESTLNENAYGRGIDIDNESYVYITGYVDFLWVFEGESNVMTIRLNNDTSGRDSPITILSRPKNSSFAKQGVSVFECNMTDDVELSNVTLYVYNSTNDLLVTNFSNVSGTINSTTFDYNFTTDEQNLWNCLVFNNATLSDWNSNRTFTIDSVKPNISLVSPLNDTSYTSNLQDVNFIFNVSDNHAISNCSLIVDGLVNLTNYSVAINQLTTLNQSFSPATYTWSVNCLDNATNINNSITRSFTVTAPASGSSGGGGSVGSPPGSDDQEDEDGESDECQKNWACSEWFECIDKEQRRECVDLSSCDLEKNRPDESRICGDEKSDETPVVEKPTIIEKIFDVAKIREMIGDNFISNILDRMSDSEPVFVCEEWQECRSLYGVDEVLEGNVILEGEQMRICEDSKKIAFDTIETRACEIRPVVEKKVIDKCSSKYLGFYEEDQLIIKMEPFEREFFGLNLDFRISDDDFCNYCEDGIRNFDEDEVDCVYSDSEKGSCPFCDVGGKDGS